MGNRATIVINSTEFDTPISLYGHWSGETNLTAVQNVIQRTDRIGDAQYLTAQLFYEFAINLGGYDGQLSFGIGAYDAINDLYDDVPTVYVNADTGEYECDGYHYDRTHKRTRIEEEANA